MVKTSENVVRSKAPKTKRKAVRRSAVKEHQDEEISDQFEPVVLPKYPETPLVDHEKKGN